jgi:hypothetical protein
LRLSIQLIQRGQSVRLVQSHRCRLDQLVLSSPLLRSVQLDQLRQCRSVLKVRSGPLRPWHPQLLQLLQRRQRLPRLSDRQVPQHLLRPLLRPVQSDQELSTRRRSDPRHLLRPLLRSVQLDRSIRLRQRGQLVRQVQSHRCRLDQLVLSSPVPRSVRSAQLRRSRWDLKVQMDP